MAIKLSFIIGIVFFLGSSTNGFAQKKSEKSHKINIVGDWIEGHCTGAESPASHFYFYKNGQFKYGVGDSEPNPISSINGEYKIRNDSSGYWLLLKIVSIKTCVNYKIDGDWGYETEHGIFGLKGGQIKTIAQHDTSFYSRRLSVCEKGKEGDSFTCPCMEIDNYRYYKISGNSGYEKF